LHKFTYVSSAADLILPISVEDRSCH